VGNRLSIKVFFSANVKFTSTCGSQVVNQSTQAFLLFEADLVEVGKGTARDSFLLEGSACGSCVCWRKLLALEKCRKLWNQRL
jgi:hypothetical protein